MVSTHPQGWTVTDKAIEFDEWNKLTIVLDGTDIFFDHNDSGAPSVDGTTAVLTLGWTGIRLGSYLGFGTANNTNIYYDDVEIKLDVAPANSVTDWHLN